MIRGQHDVLLIKDNEIELGAVLRLAQDAPRHSHQFATTFPRAPAVVSPIGSAVTAGRIPKSSHVLDGIGLEPKWREGKGQRKKKKEEGTEH